MYLVLFVGHNLLLVWLFLHLNKVTHLGGKDENVRRERHLTEALELLVIHVQVLHRRVKWVEAETWKQFHQWYFPSCAAGVITLLFQEELLPPLGQHVLQYAWKSIWPGAAATQNISKYSSEIRRYIYILRHQNCKCVFVLFNTVFDWLKISQK